MEKATLSAFQLEKFVIPEFSLGIIRNGANDIDIELGAAGTYHSKTGNYNLNLKFIINAVNPDNSKDRAEFIKGQLMASFKINDIPDFDKIPEYFYQNAIAILFPYVRAFVSNLTLQAGMPVLTLPLLNLTKVSADLKSNTKVLT